MDSASSAPSTSRIFPILLVNFIGTLGYSLLIPFLIVLVTKFEGNEFLYGVMGATYSIFQFIGAPVLGRWSDRIGRRKVLLLSQGGTFLAWVLFLVALLLPIEQVAQFGPVILTLPLVILFLARALDGLTGGNVSVANAYLADISTDENRQANFGRMGAAAHLGFVAGPVLAGFLGATAWEEIPPVLASMAISFTAILVIAFRLPESNPCRLHAPAVPRGNHKTLTQEHKDCHKLEGEKDHSFRKILSLPHIPFILVFYFLVLLAFNFYFVSFPLFAYRLLEWDVVSLGFYFSFFGSILVLTETFVLPRLAKTLSEAHLIPIGFVSMVIGFGLFMVGDPILVYVGGLFLGIGYSTTWPSFLSLLAKVAGREYQGAVQGTASSMGSLASIIGMLSGGFFFSQLNNYTFLVPAILMVGLFFLALRFRRIV